MGRKGCMYAKVEDALQNISLMLSPHCSQQESYASSNTELDIDLSALQAAVAAGKVCVAEMDIKDVERLKCSPK